MRIAVIDQPVPILTPAQIPGGHAADDPAVTAMIAAAQSEIDGPGGWLGRSLGLQTLELRSDCWPGSLPFRPIVQVVSVVVDGVPVEGVTAEWDGVLVVPRAVPRPDREVVIVYRAGYTPSPDEGRPTGAAPANAVAAVMLATQDLMAQSRADGGLRSRVVDGVYTESYNSPEMVQRTRSAACDRLLAPLRVWSL